MGLLEIISVLSGVFKFWDQVTWLIKKLEETPEEKREKLVIKVNEEKYGFEETGRPKWD